MKRIEATIRPERVDTVIDALRQTRASGVTVVTAVGHGEQRGLTQKWRDCRLIASLLPKATVWCVVTDEEATEVAETMVAAARTGCAGDGKIFISEVEQAVRVRTAERGDRVVRGEIE